ncbi:MAG: ATP-binding protein [bacterium]|nr:ATP-binding protein [bacterium]
MKKIKSTKNKAVPELKPSVEALELLKEIKDIKDIQQLTVEDVVVMFAYAEAIVETVREPLVILDEELHIKTANKAFFDSFRVNKTETYNKSIFGIGNGQWDTSELKKLLYEVLPENSIFNDYEITHKFEDIGERTMLLNARRIVLEGHQTELILLAIEDITEMKKLEKEKDDFISMVSHELKTPLTTIKMFVHLLHGINKKKKDKKSLFLSDKMNDQVERLTNMIGSFINVYSIQSGKMDIHKSYFDINKTVQKEAQTFQYSSENHAVSFIGKTSVKVFGDKERIGQVLMNLLTNAIKYSPEGNKIIVSVKKVKQEVIVSVQDFGIGIAPTQQEKIFERFYRTNGKAERSAKGLGLGLYIASEIIKSHGGKMWVESKVGKGSTFYFSLPIGKKA